MGDSLSYLDNLLIRLISNWTSCRTIQGVIVLVISNWPRASRSSDFEITRVVSNSNWTEWSTNSGSYRASKLSSEELICIRLL